MGKHTPGPWHVEPVLNENEEQFWDDDWNGKVFCVCHPQTQCDATTVVGWINENDARLIAAAPELLEAGQRLLTVFAQQRMTQAERIICGISDAGLRTEGLAAMDALSAAIAKATGVAE